MRPPQPFDHPDGVRGAVSALGVVDRQHELATGDVGDDRAPLLGGGTSDPQCAFGCSHGPGAAAEGEYMHRFGRRGVGHAAESFTTSGAVVCRHIVMHSHEGTHMPAPIRVVVAKPGLDGHDRGAKVVARALRDAGIEVVYTGLHQTPAQIVDAAIQEDADIIGLSVLSGAHLTLFAEVMDLLKAKNATDIVVFGGGIIPEDDLPLLEEMGVAKIFTPGTPTQDIVKWVQDHIKRD